MYKKIVAISLLFSGIETFSSMDLSSLPKPYNSLKELLPFNGHGWYDNQFYIKMLCETNNVSKVIEVGSLLGKSTRDIALNLPSNGYLYAIDTWLGSWEHDIMPDTKGLLPTLYNQFLSNIVHSKLTDKIIPIKMTSAQAAIYLKSEIGHIDLIYLDAAHDTRSALSDIQAYFPYIAGSRGILCGDDWLWETVSKAVLIFAQENNLTIYHENNFWFVKEENEFLVKEIDKNIENMWTVIKK